MATFTQRNEWSFFIELTVDTMDVFFLYIENDNWFTRYIVAFIPHDCLTYTVGRHARAASLLFTIYFNDLDPLWYQKLYLKLHRDHKICHLCHPVLLFRNGFLFNKTSYYPLIGFSKSSLYLIFWLMFTQHHFMALSSNRQKSLQFIHQKAYNNAVSTSLCICWTFSLIFVPIYLL